MVKNIDQVIDHNYEDLFTIVGTSEENIERLETAPYSYWRETFKQLWQNPLAIVCVIGIILLVIMALIGPWIQQYVIYTNGGTISLDKFEPYTPPNSENWLGTGGTKMGYFEGLDLWTLLWYGTRLSLILGTVVALIDTFVGLLVGSLWGYFKWLDPIMLELRNFINNIPTLLIYILLMKFLERSFWTLVFVMCLFGWMGLAGFIRNQIIIIRNREYNIASQTLGSSPKAMITHNLLPYLISVIVTVVSTAIPAAISSEVGLSFFNLSFRAYENVTLGQLLTAATSDSWQSHPYLLIAPMVVLVPLTVTFFYLGLALADATDPKNHR